MSTNLKMPKKEIAQQSYLFCMGMGMERGIIKWMERKEGVVGGNNKWYDRDVKWITLRDG